MEQYIPKSVVLAEIERRKKYYENIQMIKPVYENNIEDFNELLSFIDTLEVKEVDLERLINDYFTGWYFDNELDILAKPNNYSATVDDVKEIAKYFFELGLKAQKGE